MKRHWKIVVPSILTGFAVILNIIGWKSTSFCNFYVENVFPLWAETYGRLTGLFSFSVGEWMLYLAALLLVVLVIYSLIRLLFCRFFSEKGKRIYRNYMLVMFWIFSIVSVIMTLNCFLIYHVSPMNERYRIGSGEKKEYGVSEIRILRNYVVEEANALAAEMKRDKDGYLIYEGDMKKEAAKQMKRLGETYENLQGYYPAPKPLYASYFFSQQYIMGYYFPFSMEANYNDMMYIVNMPATMCHELSHLKGFILEDEANFIGYLACVDSEDDFFRYSGYLSVINYLDRDFYKAVGKDKEVYLSNPLISVQVLEDKKFLTKEEWEKVEKEAVLDTEMVKEASDIVVETNLTLNGVKDGKISYSRVVDLLLQYYDGILY